MIDLKYDNLLKGNFDIGLNCQIVCDASLKERTSLIIVNNF